MLPAELLVTRISWSEFWLLLSGTREVTAFPVGVLSARLEEQELSASWRLGCVWCEPPIADVDRLINDLGWISDNAAQESPSTHAFTDLLGR